MSTTIDEKVVEMRFENDQFEANVDETIKSIDDLKRSLNFDGAAKGLTEIDKAASNVSFDNMAKSLSVLEKRFSTVGIVGMRVIQNLTDSAMRLVSRTLTSIPSRIIEGGKARAANIENARFMLHGLMEDEDQINEIMKNAMDSVTDTAYGYGDAARAAAMFAGANVKAGEEMARALKGLTGVTATFNASYEDMADVFTDIASASKITGEHFNRLAERGVPAASILTKYINEVATGSKDASEEVKKTINEITNGLELTEEEVKKLSTKGVIDFTVFAEAMSSTFGENAGKANETINGVTANIQAAFSKIGAKFISPLIEQNNPIIKLLDTVRQKINDVNGAIDPIAKTVTGTILTIAGHLDNLIQKFDVTGLFNKIGEVATRINNFWLGKDIFTKDDFKKLELYGDRLTVFKKLISSVAKQHGIDVDAMIKNNGGFANSLKKGWLNKEIFTEAINKLKSLDGSVDSTSVNAVKRFEAIREAAKKTIKGDYGNGIKRIEKLNKEGFDSKTVQNYVNAIHKLTKGTWNYNDAILDTAEAQLDLGSTLDDMSDAELTTIGFTEKEIKSLRELQKTAKETGTPLNELIASFEKPGFLESVIMSVKNVGSGIISTLNTVKKAAAKVFNTNIKGALSTFGAALLSITSHFRLSSEVTDKLQKVFEGFFTVVKVLGSIALGILSKIAPVLGKVANGVLNVAAFLGEFITNTTASINKSETFNKIITALGNGLSFVKNIITEAINRVRTWAQETGIANTVIEAFRSTVEKVVTTIKDFFGREDVRQKLETIKSAVQNFGEEVLKVIDNVTNKLKNPKDTFDEYSGKLQTKLEKAKGVVARIRGWFEKTIAEIKGLASKSPAEIFKVLSTNITSGIESVKADLEKAINGADVVGFLKGKFDAIVQAVTGFKDQLHGATASTSNLNLFGDFAPQIETFLQTMKSIFKNVNVGGIVSMIAGLSVLAGVKKAFESLESVIKLMGNLSNDIKTTVKDSLGIIQKFVQDTFGKMIDAFAAAEKAKAFKDKAKGFLILAAGIAVIAGAIYFLGKMDRDQLIQGGAAVAIIAGVMVGIIAAVSAISTKFGNGFAVSGKNMLSVGLGLLLFVASLKLMLKVLTEIQNYKIENIKSFLGKLLIVIGSLVAVSFAMSKVGFSSGFGLLALVLSLKLFLSVIDDINNIDLNAIQKNIGTFIAIIAALAFMMLWSRVVGQNALKAGAMFIGIGLAIKMIAEAMVMIGNMNPQKAAQGINQIMKVLWMFNLMMVVSLAIGQNSAKAGIMFIGIAAALLAMGLAIKVLGSMNPSDAQRGLAIVTALLAMFSVVMLASHFVGDAYKTVMMMAMTIAILTICVGALSMLDPNDMIRVTVCLSMLMGAFSLMMLAFGQVAWMPITRSMANILLMVGMFAALAAGLVILDKMNLTSALENAKALSLLMISLSACLAIITKAGVGFKGALSASGGLAVFVGVITGIALIAGKIDEVTNGKFVGLLDRAVPFFRKFGELLGSVIGGIIDGISPNLSGGLKSLGDGLTSLVNSVGPFFETVSGMDLENVGKIKDLADALLMLTASSFIDGITGWIRGAGDLDSFGESLGKLATGLVNYSNIVSLGKFDSDTVDKSMNLASMLAAFASHELPKSGGLLQLITGESDLSGFGEALPGLALHLRTFANIVKDGPFDGDSTDKAMHMASMLAALASNEIPTEGGFLSKIFGSKSLGKFGENLPALGIGLKAFALEIQGISFSEDKISVVERMVGALSTLSNADINATGGFGAMLFGGDDLKSIGSGLKSLAKGIGEFATELKDADELNNGNVDKAIDFMNEISGLTGIQVNVSSLTSGISNVGAALSVYSQQISGIDFDGQMAKSLTFISDLKSKASGGVDTSGFDSLAQSLSKLDFKSSFKDATRGLSNDVSSTASSITRSFTEALKNGIGDISVDVSPILSGIASSISNKSGELLSAGRDLANKLKTGIMGGIKSIPTMFSQIFTAVLLNVRQASTAISSAGKTLANNFVKSLKVDSGTVSRNLTSGLSDAVSRIRSYYGSFYSAGSYAAQGYANGIISKISSVVAAGNRLAKAGQSAVKSADDSNSPSREYYKLGSYGGQGYVNALLDYTKHAYKAGLTLSTSSRKGLQNAVSKISDILQNGVDNAPTIRPVLDLSDVRDGAGQIGDILAASGYGINTPYHIDAAAAVVSSRNNVTNTDVVEAIRALDKGLSNMQPGNTYNLNGITYDDGTNIAEAIGVLVRAARMERRA